jgi:macrolide-specific efflux system membrane fusion protein
MKRKALIATLLVCIIAVAAAFHLYRTRSAQPAVTASAAPPAPAPKELSLPARLQAISAIEVAAPISGTIEAFHAEVGAEVYEGQLIAQITNRAAEGQQDSARSQLESTQARVNDLDSAVSATRLEESRASAEAARARSELDRADRVFRREKMLLAEGATPRRVHDRAAADFSAAEAQAQTSNAVADQARERLDGLQKQLDAARRLLDAKSEELEEARAHTGAGQVLAPASGVVTSRRGEVGENVNPEVRDLFRIATDLSSMAAVAEPDPAALSFFKPGQPALVTIAELLEPLQGIVKSVSSGRVTVEFQNPSPLVKPGLGVQITVQVR